MFAILVCMGGGLLGEWQAAVLPVVVGSQWSVSQARAGLVEIGRLRAALDAAQAVLVGVLAAVSGRDTAAAVVRATKMSTAEARRAEVVARVCGQVEGALAALASGDVSAGHLVALGPVADDVVAGSLLERAAGEGVDDFVRTVRRHRLEVDGAGVVERQRRARTLQFCPTEDGGLRIHAVLTQLDGARVRAAVERRCDERWRVAHPERAVSVGGHGDEPRDRRLADALVELVTGGGGCEPGGGGCEPGGGSGGGAGGGVRTGVVVVVDEASMTATVAGGDPVALDEVAALAADARTELYGAVRSMNGAVLAFGRSRRFASPLQKLALIARDGGRCVWPGCEVPWTRCDVDHRIDWDRGGPTDVGNLRLLCTARHHPHRHEHGREPDDPDPPG
jgi:hypothetical protein